MVRTPTILLAAALILSTTVPVLATAAEPAAPDGPDRPAVPGGRLGPTQDPGPDRAPARLEDLDDVAPGLHEDSADDPSTVPAPIPGTTTVYPPIHIVGDAMLGACVCTTGSGTPDDPYVIEDATIVTAYRPLVGDYGAALMVEDTSAHLVVRDIHIVKAHGYVDAGFGLDTTTHGMRYEDVDNLTVRRVTFETLGEGTFAAGIVAWGDHVTIRDLEVDTIEDAVAASGDDLEIRNVTGIQVAAGGDDILVSDVHTSDWLLVWPSGTARVERSSSDRVFWHRIDEGGQVTVVDSDPARIYSGCSWLVWDQAECAGRLRVEDSRVGSGGILANGNPLAAEGTVVQGDVVLAGQNFVRISGDGSETILERPDLTLARMEIDGNLSARVVGDIATDGNVVDGVYEVTNFAGAIPSWTVGEPDRAHGLPVAVVHAGETLADARVAFAASFGGALRNVTVDARGGTVAVLAQGDTTIQGLDGTASADVAVASAGGDLTVDATRLRAAKTGIVFQGGHLAVGASLIEADVIGVEADDATLSLDGSRVRDTIVGLYLGTGSTKTAELSLTGSAVRGQYAIVQAALSPIHLDGCTLDATTYDAVYVRNTVEASACTVDGASDSFQLDETCGGIAFGHIWPCDGFLDVHDANLRAGEDHVRDEDDDFSDPGNDHAMQGNWWAPDGEPRIVDDTANTSDATDGPIEAAPDVAVVEVADGWRIDAADDHGLLVDAWWTLPDGSRVDVDGPWPVWDTLLSADRVGSGTLTAHVVDGAGIEATASVTV